MADPLFILAPPRSFTSVACAMLGQHPSAYGLPEVNLHVADSMDTWWRLLYQTRSFLSHGLLRAVAQLFVGEQTDESVGRAHWWIQFRRGMSTSDVFRELAGRVDPRTLVDKSPATVVHPDFLCRALTAFPGARFLHLTRHPRTTCESIQAAPEILASLQVFSKFADLGSCSAISDPEALWLASHRNIGAFLDPLPGWQRLRVRGEDLLGDPGRCLRDIAGWAGLPVNDAVLEEMKHPERSPFACFGPAAARYGNDPKFLERPALRPERVRTASLEGPAAWRNDGAGLSSDVKRLAAEFGYA